MRIHCKDTYTLPCGCLASEVRFFDEEGAEFENLLEFEILPSGARAIERLDINGREMFRERFGAFRAQCRHSKPYANGHAVEIEG